MDILGLYVGRGQINFYPMMMGISFSTVISILVCFMVYNLQIAVPERHRRMEAGLIWLLLIPLFNLVWNFFVFLRVPESYQRAFAERGEPHRGVHERSLGLAFSICAVVGAVVPCCGLIAALAALVLLILFLIRMYDLKAALERGGGFPVIPPNPPPL